MAVKNLTKDTVVPRTGTFLHKTELDTKKVRPRIILKYQSIAEVFKHIVGEYVMKAYTAVRGVSQVFVYLAVIWNWFISSATQNCRGKEKKTKQELSKLHSELKQDGESQKYYVSLILMLMEFKIDTTTDIQVGLHLLLSDMRFLLSDTVITRSSTKRDCHVTSTSHTILMSES
jgi:hypothetical protein